MIRGTHPPQSTNAFVQTRRKDAVDVAEHRVRLLAVQFLAKEPDDRFELLGGADLEDLVLENGSRREGLESDGNWIDMMSVSENPMWVFW
mgnify:CR=1 FL=1